MPWFNLPFEMRLALLVLATWRLTHLFVAEDGPWDLVLRLRARLGDSFAGRAMDCFYCLSLWIAAPLAPLAGGDALTWLIAWLAVSGAASLLEQATSRAPDRPVITYPTAPSPGRIGETDELLWRPPTAAEDPATPAGAAAKPPAPDSGAPADLEG